MFVRSFFYNNLRVIIMKRFMFLLCVTLLLFWGCDDENSNPNSYKDFSLINSALGISNVGTLHNSALALFMSDTTISIDDTTESIRALNWSINCIRTIDPSRDSLSMYQNGTAFSNYFAGKNIDTIVKSYVYAKFPLVNAAFSYSENDILTRAMNFMNNYNFSSLSSAQRYTLIISKADSLLIEYNAIDWDTVSTSSFNKGEAVGGLLYTMKSSAQYWNTNSPSASKPEALIFNDALGYLGGWFTAAYVEHVTYGHWDIKNQRTRISAGVAGAVVASGGFALKFAGYL